MQLLLVDPLGYSWQAKRKEGGQVKTVQFWEEHWKSHAAQQFVKPHHTTDRRVLRELEAA